MLYNVQIRDLTNCFLARQIRPISINLCNYTPDFNFRAFPLKPEETRPLSFPQTARLRILTMEGHSEGVYVIQ
jgi:hypothetical protein